MNLNLSNSTLTDYSSITAYSIDPLNVDGVNAGSETRWTNKNWSTYWAWFNGNAKVKNAILMKAIWNVGKGYEALDEYTRKTLDYIKGDGKQSFKDILFSMECNMRIGGDAFAEIVTHNKKHIQDGGKIVNIKLLNPGLVTIVYDETATIKKYEYSVGAGGKTIEFDPEEILHMSNNRMCGQIHGISDLEALRKVILADSQSFDNVEKIVNFQARPFIIFKLKTDNLTKIAEFAAKLKSIRTLGEDALIPDDENLLSYEVVQVNPSAIIMAWRDDIRNEYYRCIGLPQIMPGAGGQGTESEAKVIYVAFEQIVQHDQLNWENAIWSQLGLKINMIHPTLMEDLLKQDNAKDGANAMNIQPSELNPMSANQS